MSEIVEIWQKIGEERGREAGRAEVLRSMLTKGFEKAMILGLGYTEEEYCRGAGTLAQGTIMPTKMTVYPSDSVETR